MINVSPIGRSCSQEERVEFYELDKVSYNSWKIPSIFGRGRYGQVVIFKKLSYFVQLFHFNPLHVVQVTSGFRLQEIHNGIFVAVANTDYLQERGVGSGFFSPYIQTAEHPTSAHRGPEKPCCKQRHTYQESSSVYQPSPVQSNKTIPFLANSLKPFKAQFKIWGQTIFRFFFCFFVHSWTCEAEVNLSHSIRVLFPDTPQLFLTWYKTWNQIPQKQPLPVPRWMDAARYFSILKIPCLGVYGIRGVVPDLRLFLCLSVLICKTEFHQELKHSSFLPITARL